MSQKNLNVVTRIPKILQKQLNNKKIGRIYKKFEKNLNLNKSFAVAVSGGPDSLALAVLAKIYAIKKKLVSKFFIVDHKIRKESSQEAKLIRRKLSSVGINAQILIWKGKKPTKNIQSLARKKRYELLIANSSKSKIKNILLGHHEGDVLENFFIRILRGSGLKGLVSFDKKARINKINLLRPLLDHKKDDLIFIAKYVFNFYVKDPSNENDLFKRVKIRKLIDEMQKNGLDKKKFLNTIKNLKYSDKAIKFYVNKNLNENTHYSSKENDYTINMNFFQQPHEIVFRSLAFIINIIGGRYYSPRGKKIDMIINKIHNKVLSKVTLGGCIIEMQHETVIISKEY
tara:strand:- start:775 stop:1803 length:1029 start_codon:yes stop_codon:yes gene_type:complete